MPDIDRLSEAVETLKARVGASEQARHDDRREAKEDRHKLAGFASNHEARLDVLEERVPKDLVSRLDRIDGALGLLRWLVGAIGVGCSVVMAWLAVRK